MLGFKTVADVPDVPDVSDVAPISSPDVTALLWDLGGVLIDVDLKAVAAGWADLNAGSLVSDFFESGLKRAFDLGLLSVEELLGELTDRTGYAWTEPVFRDLWCRALTPNPALLAVASQLAARLASGIISNTDPVHAAFIEASCDVASWAPSRTYSYAAGALKPAHLIFRSALDALGEPHSQVLLIDDRPENVAAARQLGLQAVVYTGLECLPASLYD